MAFTSRPGHSKHDQVLISDTKLHCAFVFYDPDLKFSKMPPAQPSITKITVIHLTVTWDKGLCDDDNDDEVSKNRIAIAAHAGEHIPIF